MAKLTRESRLREKRAEKAARKAARKLEAENPQPYEDGLRDEEGFLRDPEGAPDDEHTESPAPAADSPLAAVAETASDA